MWDCIVELVHLSLGDRGDLSITRNGAKPFCCNIVNWTLEKKISEILIEINTFSFKKNPFQNVIWKMAAISLRSQIVKVLCFVLLLWFVWYMYHSYSGLFHRCWILYDCPCTTGVNLNEMSKNRLVSIQLKHKHSADLEHHWDVLHIFQTVNLIN